MNRRFLYMIVEAASGGGSCTLRRINPSRLFYPKDSPERAAAAVATSKAAAKARLVEDARLPPPTTTLLPYTAAHFALLGRDKDKILVFADKHEPFGLCKEKNEKYATPFGSAVLYDDGSRTFHVLPSPRCTKIDPFWVAVGESMYFMEDVRQSRVDDRYATTVNALIPHCQGYGEYSWQHLVPPPQERMDWKSDLTAYAAVGESSIWVSTGRHGTLALDTAKLSWSKADTVRGEWSKAGDWPLPFVGRASEQGGLWFGFSAGTASSLEAWDLRADVGPASRLRWGDMPGIVGGTAVESEVAVLGDGRLCVGRLFEVPHPQRPRRHCPCLYRRHRNYRKHPRARERPRPPRLFAMLTGVEVVDDGDGEGVRLIEHKSCRYNLGELEDARLLRRRKFAQLLF